VGLTKIQKMKTAIPISKDNNADGHICQCGSHGASAISEKNETAAGCGCGESHSHVAHHHHHEGHVCECDHHHDAQKV
jgi:hypothetical protein